MRPIQAFVGFAIAGAVTAAAPRASAQYWQSTPQGCGTRVTSGWVVGCTPSGGPDYYVYQDNGTSWQQVGSDEFDFMTSDLNGNPWVINGFGEIYRWNGSSFVYFDSYRAWTTVGVGDASSPYEIWATDSNGGIWNYSGTISSPGNWAPIPGTATKVAVFNETTTCGTNTIHVPFVVTSSDSIYEYEFQNYQTCFSGTGCSQGCFNPVNGGATDIARDIVLGTDGNVYDWTGSMFSFFAGPPSGSSITHLGGTSFMPWIITNAPGSPIFYWNPPPPP